MSLFSSTASLRSSILRSMEENGRKYHGYKEGKYVLPVDEVSFPGPFSLIALLFWFRHRLLATLTDTE